MSPTPGTLQILQILQTLVGFPTVSRDPNLGLIEWGRDGLARQGVACRLTCDATRTKATLFATVGAGPRPGLMVDGQDWHSDPFTATLRDGRLYGRGSADMKGLIAVALALVPRLLQRRAPDAPVHLALSYDEEVDCIVGEPTLMAPVLGHKGARTWRCCVRGREAHSALATAGVNAVENAVLLPAMRAVAPESEIRFEPIGEVPAFDTAGRAAGGAGAPPPGRSGALRAFPRVAAGPAFPARRPPRRPPTDQGDKR